MEVVVVTVAMVVLVGTPVVLVMTLAGLVPVLTKAETEGSLVRSTEVVEVKKIGTSHAHHQPHPHNTIQLIQTSIKVIIKVKTLII